MRASRAASIATSPWLPPKPPPTGGTITRIAASLIRNVLLSCARTANGALVRVQTVSRPLSHSATAALDVHRNLHHGKVAVLCLAPHEGLGVRDPELRAKHLTKINRFRNE